MVRAYITELARGVTIALSIAIVIAFAAVGCMLNKRDANASRVQGFRASASLVLVANKACTLWGQRVTELERVPSGRAGYDAVLVQGKAANPFFVLVPVNQSLCN